ncbi:MAG: hypothetical protein ACFB51_01680 [Anaerolineae bacterium]
MEIVDDDSPELSGLRSQTGAEPGIGGVQRERLLIAAATQTEDIVRQVRAVRLLAAHAEPRHIPVLLQALSLTVDNRLYSAVVGALYRVDALPQIVEAFFNAHYDPRVRKALHQVLRIKLENGDTRVLDLAAEHLTEEADGDPRALAEAIMQFNPLATSRYVEFFPERNLLDLVWIIRRRNIPGTPALIAWLERLQRYARERGFEEAPHLLSEEIERLSGGHSG